MMRKAILPLLMLSGIYTFSFAQTGTLNGSVTTADHQPAPDVTVRLEGTRFSTLTGKEGQYKISLPVGTYHLVLSSIGFAKQTRSVIIRENAKTTADFVLQQSSQQLHAVTINSGYNKFYKKESDYVARMPLKNLENPQVYNVIPKELAEEQLTVDYGSLLKNVTGGALILNETGASDMTLRGFTTRNYLRNGMATYSTDMVDPVSIERIEVLKGPSATLFGSSLISYGGVLDRISKKPYGTFGGTISYFAGSWDLNRLTVDINTPLSADKTVLFRMNGAYHEEKSFQDAGMQTMTTVAPSFLYKASDRLTLSLDAEFFRRNGTVRPVLSFDRSAFADIDRYDQLPVHYKQSLTSDDFTSVSTVTNLYAQAGYQLSDQWTSTTTFVFSENGSPDGPGNFIYASLKDDTTVIRNVFQLYGLNNSYQQIQQNFNGDFAIGKMRNRIVVGLDYFRYSHSQAGRLYFLYDTVYISQRIPSISQASVAAKAAVQDIGASSRSGQSTYSAYVSDVLNLTDRLLVMASVRADHYAKTESNKGQTTFSPKFGIVYQPVKEKVALFANYMNGFTNQFGEDFNGNAFHSEQANQVEGGIKTKLVHDRINFTASYYYIKVKDIVRPDYDHLNFSLQDGTRESKGFEAEIVANPSSGLNLIAGYGYNKSVYLQGDTSIAGKVPAGVPQHTVNFWVSYKLLHTALKDFGIGVGGNYQSEVYFDQANTFYIPAYTRLDATVFFDRPKFRVGVKVNNLANKKTWSINGMPQDLRQFIASVSYKF